MVPTLFQMELLFGLVTLQLLQNLHLTLEYGVLLRVDTNLMDLSL